MDLTLARMQALLRKGLGGLDSSDLTDVEADELLNLALWDLEDKFPFRAKETEMRFPLVVDQFEYTIPTTTDAISSIALLDSEAQRHKLVRKSRDWMDENIDETGGSEGATPTFYLREDTTLILYPIPDAILTVIMTLKVSITSLLTSSVTSTGLPRNWDVLVVQGGIMHGHIFAGDYNEARQIANFQLTAVRSAVLTLSKEEKADSRYARLNVIDSFPEDQ
ncbi:hypothetical protein LCGC14_1542100 [marine sediment metagenome]|uniref:Uncharacterized protein n=1 Tax=marine sediment metagenome TaxID=412755 RepID=A0A0F9ISR3_9ZZZZ